MALLVDKYRPRTLDALTYHENLSERLRLLVSHYVAASVNITDHLTRRKAETFHISSCMDLVELGRSLV